MNRVQLNRWVLEITSDYLTSLAKSRGFKRGAMLDKVVEEYRDPPVSYLLDKLIEKLPLETYFTEAEKKQLNQLRDLVDEIRKDNPKQE